VLHYATNLDGELDHESIFKGRRLLSGMVQTVVGATARATTADEAR
jgi:hypothetical protein